tara:strand:+ start:1002 stop:2165 length:1164 start_codon:yes stop_codon:yes gene_type:complete
MPSHESKRGNLFKFGRDDIFYNRIKTYPKVDFFIYDGAVYYNNENQTALCAHTPQGHINLYELNVSRSAGQLIYPFVTKDGSFTSFSTISTEAFNQDFAAGDEVTGSYVLTSSIAVDRYATAFSGDKKKVLYALKNSLDQYASLSPHYAYSSSFGDKESQMLNIVSIPSIFYGSSIKKGSVVLKFYVTGSLIAEASDTKKDGVLLQTTSSSDGSGAHAVGDAVGVVLYNEGFIVLTSSAHLSQHGESYAGGGAVSSSWHYFGSTDTTGPSSSFSLEFNGVNYVETATMFAHAEENQLNFSNNPTFLVTGTFGATSGSNYYVENPKTEIKNIASSSHPGHSASFSPVTYISKIGIYDKDKNLIAVAGLANPVRKKEKDSYTFKLKLDI